MTQKCDHCNKNLNKGDSRVKCDFCDFTFHYECATELTPSLTKTALDVVKKTGGSLTYKCNTCLKANGSKSDVLNTKLDNLEKCMRDIAEQLMEIKKDLTQSINRSDGYEKIVNSKIKKLEAENNTLRRQINRADIIVTGLPPNISNENLYTTIVDLAKVLNIEISLTDLHFCSWIGKKAAVLVKFNSILNRDLLMKSYRNKYDLKLNEVIPMMKEHSRIYINDHHTPLVSKFRYYCRKLVKDKVIQRFEMLNWDIPRAKVYLHDGKVEEGDLEYVIKLFTGGLSADKNTAVIADVLHH